MSEKDRRHKNAPWLLRAANEASQVDDTTVTHALLMDIRDELRMLNATLGYRFQSHFHKGMDAMIRADKRLAKKVSLRAKQHTQER